MILKKYGGTPQIPPESKRGAAGCGAHVQPRTSNLVVTRPRLRAPTDNMVVEATSVPRVWRVQRELAHTAWKELFGDEPLPQLGSAAEWTQWVSRERQKSTSMMESRLTSPEVSATEDDWTPLTFRQPLTRESAPRDPVATGSLSNSPTCTCEWGVIRERPNLELRGTRGSTSEAAGYGRGLRA